MNIVDSFSTNRGRVLVTDIEFDSGLNTLQAGDQVSYGEDTFTIQSVEALLQIGGKEFIAFIVK